MSRAALIETLLRTSMRVSGTVAPSLGARLAVRVFGSPVPQPMSSGARAFLYGADRRDVPWSGGKVATYAVGEGPAVLLVHGWSAHAASLRAFATALAARGCRAVAVDLPAHGASSGSWSNIVACGEALGAVAAAVGPVHGAVGHSFGAPSLLLGMERGWLPPPPRLATIGAPVDMDKIVRDFCGRMGVPPRAEAHMRRRMDAVFGGPFTEFAVAAVAARLGDGLLVAHDTEDQDVPVAEAHELAGDLGRLLITTGLGHNRVLRDPGVVEAVAAHLCG